MPESGLIIGGKYELLYEIGRGGMSVVYLAADRRLNKNWAVKFIDKTADDEQSCARISSLLSEAEIMKRFDHPALPRIVDIIESETGIYIVMDYIIGLPLGKYLREKGVPPESIAIGWCIQACEALLYLHSLNPPVIYRDMKPSNLMLSPEGNIKIIDFGAAVTYDRKSDSNHWSPSSDEHNTASCKVSGTRGYAPPEQYIGHTDPRSDIFSFGMTMRCLFTGTDPQSSNSDISVKELNPSLSDRIDYIIRKCTDIMPQNRYQCCSALLKDLRSAAFQYTHFSKIPNVNHSSQRPISSAKAKHKKRIKLLSTFLITGALMNISGIGFRLSTWHTMDQKYKTLLTCTDPESYFSAIKIFPDRADAYLALIDYCKHQDVSNNYINLTGNAVDANAAALNTSSASTADMYYQIGRLYFSEYNGSFKERALNARMYFQLSAESSSAFDKKELAKCYYLICSFTLESGNSSEHSREDYEVIFEEIDQTLKAAENASGSEANYDKISLYYTVLLFINSEAEYMARTGFDRQTVINLMNSIYEKTNNISSSLQYVNNLKAAILSDLDSFIYNVNANYNEAKKHRTGGDTND